MDLIKTSIGFTRTIKNVARFREIISIFARNGLDEFIIKSGLHKVVPNFVLPKARLSQAMEEIEDATWAATIGYRIRRSFEELGPGYMKLGQLLSTREDIFPKDFTDQMKYLRDKAKGIEFKEVLNIVELAYGGAWQETFEEIKEVPLGTASIGLVYQATLKSGENVVLKVRRPGIKKIIESDLNIAKFIIERVERISEDLKYFGVSRILRDFGSSLNSELDFNLEALNCRRLKENLEEIDNDDLFHLPKIYNELCRENIIVMECLDGIPFSDSVRVADKLDIIQEKLEKSLSIFVTTLLKNGFFHADLHGGNFFLLEDHKIGLIDFGLMGHLSKKGRSSLIIILYSLINYNYENLVYEFLDVAEYEEIPDIDSLIRDVRDALSPFVGLTVKQMNLTLLLNKTISTLTKHKIYLPTEWFIISRALITLDGVGKTVDMDIDIFSIIDDNVKDVAKEVLSKDTLMEEGLMISRDVLSSLRVLPRHIRWFLKEFSKNNYSLRIEHFGHEQAVKDIKDSVLYVGNMGFSAIMIISGVLLIENSTLGEWYAIPRISWVFWGFAVVLFLRAQQMIRR